MVLLVKIKKPGAGGVPGLGSENETSSGRAGRGGGGGGSGGGGGGSGGGDDNDGDRSQYVSSRQDSVEQQQTAAAERQQRAALPGHVSSPQAEVGDIPFGSDERGARRSNASPGLPSSGPLGATGAYDEEAGSDDADVAALTGALASSRLGAKSEGKKKEEEAPLATHVGRPTSPHRGDEKEAKPEEQNSISPTGAKQEVQAAAEEAERHTRSRASISPDVAVYLAPAVLGHRWVRSRSSAYIVERPERLRATLLGVAGLLGRLQSTMLEEKSKMLDTKSQAHQPVKSEDDAAAGLLALAAQLDSLSVRSSSTKGDEEEAHTLVQNNLAIILSRASTSLTSLSAGLQAIHAHPDEVLQPQDIGGPPAYLASMQNFDTEASISATKLSRWPAGPASYVSLLATLCTVAPSTEPPAAPPRVHRLGQPLKDEPLDNESSDYPSEIPEHMSQGDLYLCGVEPHSVRRGEDSYFAENMQPLPHTPSPPAGTHVVSHSVSAGSCTGDPSVAVLPSTPQAKTSETGKQKAENWLERGSLGAIEASLGTCCAALDGIVRASQGISYNPSDCKLESVDVARLDDTPRRLRDNSASELPATSRRAFILARPPGHHCTATKPSGFCWVNNVAVLTAHAFDVHGIDRVAILDFDLHHGDGTQSIAWRVNADTFRADVERDARIRAHQAELAPKQRKGRKSTGKQTTPEDQSPSATPDWDALVGRRGLKISYGSLHDIESFPCEDGDKDKVSDASVCLEGAHGQWIQNVHLDGHPDRSAFLTAYESKYARLFSQARRFFSETDAKASKSLIVLSAGFDACVHEHPGMQRHGKSVPTEFYTMFARDAVRLAVDVAEGKCISVLEGGYSDRALTSGVAAHLVGLAGLDSAHSDQLCQLGTLAQLEKLAKAASANMMSSHSSTPTVSARRRPELSARDPNWLRFALEAFKRLQECCGQERISSERHGLATAPATPMGPTEALSSGLSGQLWRSPRETRAHKAGGSAKASPIK